MELKIAGLEDGADMSMFILCEGIRCPASALLNDRAWKAILL